MLRTLSIILFALSGTANFSLAQSVSGRISGTIVDPQSAVIVGAEILLNNEGTGERQTRPSNEAGVFVFPSLAPGL